VLERNQNGSRSSITFDWVAAALNWKLSCLVFYCSFLAAQNLFRIQKISLHKNRAISGSNVNSTNTNTWGTGILLSSLFILSKLQFWEPVKVSSSLHNWNWTVSQLITYLIQITVFIDQSLNLHINREDSHVFENQISCSLISFMKHKRRMNWTRMTLKLNMYIIEFSG